MVVKFINKMKKLNKNLDQAPVPSHPCNDSPLKSIRPISPFVLITPCAESPFPFFLFHPLSQLNPYNFLNSIFIYAF